MKTHPLLVSTFGRSNMLKAKIFAIFFGISSYPRLFLEVHLRKNFGYRYFKMISALTIGIPLAIAPLYIMGAYLDSGMGILKFLLHFASWYGVLVAFFNACIKRQKEITYQPGVYDFAKVSDYSGDRNPLLEQLVLLGKPVSIKIVVTVLEPGIFFFIGLGLLMLQQPIGYVITLCSIIYSLCYYGAIFFADEAMMDTIDSIIRQEELANVIIKGRGPKNTRGFEMFCEFPEEVDLRQRIFDAIQSETEILQAY